MTPEQQALGLARAVRELSLALELATRQLVEARRRSDLRTLARAADGAAGALGSRWWYLTWLALETALWASQRAEEATGASLADAAAVLETEA